MATRAPDPVEHRAALEVDVRIDGEAWRRSEERHELEEQIDVVLDLGQPTRAATDAVVGSRWNAGSARPAIVAPCRLRDPVGLRFRGEGEDRRTLDAVLRGDPHLVQIGISRELDERGNAGLPAEATHLRAVEDLRR